MAIGATSDGEYVLIQYSYGPGEKQSGSYLQLFTRDGRFVEEITEFSEDTFAQVGYHAWLNNNGIVYYEGKELVL